MKKLYRSEKDVKIAGVCGGIAEYFSLDPTLVRLLWLLAIFFAFSGFWAYIIAVLIIPKRPFADTGSWQGKAGPDGQNNDSYADTENNSYKDTGNGEKVWIKIIKILAGPMMMGGRLGLTIRGGTIPY